MTKAYIVFKQEYFVPVEVPDDATPEQRAAFVDKARDLIIDKDERVINGPLWGDTIRYPDSDADFHDVPIVTINDLG